MLLRVPSRPNKPPVWAIDPNHAVARTFWAVGWLERAVIRQMRLIVALRWSVCVVAER